MRAPFRPMLATLSKTIVGGPEWIYEEKYDGIRALAVRRRGTTRLYSRTLQDLTAAFPDVASAVDALPGNDLVLDGELVVLDARGVSRFQLLQRRGVSPRTKARYAVFDLLERKGSLLDRPLAERREGLEAVLRASAAPLLISRRLVRDGKRAHAIARKRGWEGVIAKDERSVYVPGTRSRSWLKIKIRRESEFVVGGYTAPEGSRAHLGAILVGLYDGPRLRYTGKVGTGFTGDTLADLAFRLAPLAVTECPFDPAPRAAGTIWVRPRLVAQVIYAEWTSDGKLRQPSFAGLRHDKKPRECLWSEREP